MAELRSRARHAGIADEDVELAAALMQRRAKPRNAVGVGEAERHQRGAAAVFADLVVELFQPALRARHRHDVRAAFGQRNCGGIADAARGAGDEGDTVSEGFGHQAGVLQTWMTGTSPAMTQNDASRQLASASSDSCRGCGSVWFWSVRL